MDDQLTLTDSIENKHEKPGQLLKILKSTPAPTQTKKLAANFIATQLQSSQV